MKLWLVIGVSMLAGAGVCLALVLLWPRPLWEHLALTRDAAGEVTLYYQGETTLVLPAQTGEGTASLWICGRHLWLTCSPSPLDTAVIGNIRVYTRRLDEAELRLLADVPPSADKEGS